MSIGSSLLQSSGLLLLLNVINRGIGVVSTIILARILAPEDFGIIALASLVIHFFEAISNTGTKEYVIQKKQLTDEDISTSWTLNLSIKLVIWFLFILLTPFISSFYGNPELYYVLLAISLMVPITALANSGLFLFMKDLNYKPLFYLDLSQKLVAFFITVTIAIIYQSYWAMIVGIVVSVSFKTIASYFVHDFRPRISFKNIKLQWQFSKWMLSKGGLGFARAEIDTFLVSKIFDLGVLGGFNMMKSLVNMIGWDVINPATVPLLSSFSRVKTDLESLRFQLLLSFYVVISLSLPVVLFINLYHEKIVFLLLGEQWGSYSPLLGVLSILVLTYGITSILQHLFTSLGKVKVLFIFEIAGLIITTMSLLLIEFETALYFSYVRSILAIILTIIMLIYVRFLIKLSGLRYLKLIFPVVVAGLCSWLMLNYLSINLEINVFFDLLINGIYFMLIYVITMIIFLYRIRSCEEVIYLRWIADKGIKALRQKITG